MDLRFLLLQLCFFTSGFAALLYETAWTREFAFIFGTSELAVSAVLAAYMAGLALGAALAARIAPRISRPVLAYGVIELGIAVGALAVPYAIRSLMGVYVGWLGGLSAPPESFGIWVALFHLFGTFVVLIPCTLLMGATLPLLARHAVRSDEEIGPRIGLLYAVNTAGAILGALVAAFLLLPEIGLRQTIYMGAVANAVVFGASILLARRVPVEDRSSRERPRGPFLILPLIAISGAVSFAYEVLWFRLLGFILGGSTSAFASMLASFLLGIALGSALASRWARRTSTAVLGFAIAQLATAALAWSTFYFSEWIPVWVGNLGASASNLTAGAVVAVGVLLPVTLCIGASFPFAVRIFAQGVEDAGPGSARVYAWNTFGSIVGSVATGFFLLPSLGFEGTLILGVAINLVLAAITALRLGSGRAAKVLPGLALAMLVAVALLPPDPPMGILRLSVMTGRPVAGEVEYLGVGRSATVTVIKAPHTWKFATNGLPESSIFDPLGPSDQYHEGSWLSLLPLLARPDALDSMLLIGLGGGGTLSAVPDSVQRIDLIELEPEVVEANRHIGPFRGGGDPLLDPRVRLILGDARGAMMLSDARYDAVVSQPSHPWTSGASHLYTREFFHMVHERLVEGGVFVQWMGLAFVDEELTRGLVATLLDEFEHLAVLRPVGAALLFIASDESLNLLENTERAIANASEDFDRIGIHRIEDVAAAIALMGDGPRDFSVDGLRISDDHNHLAWAARRRRAAGPRPGGRLKVLSALAEFDPLPEHLSELNDALLFRRLTARGMSERAAQLAGDLPELERTLATAWQMFESGRDRRAAGLFERALKLDPEAVEAKMGLRWIKAVADEGDAQLPGAFQSLIAASAASGAGNWAEVEALDSELALWKPGSLFYPESTRMRMHWRLAKGDAAAVREVIELSNPLLSRAGRVGDYVSRARAAHRLGNDPEAWVTLGRMLLNAHRDATPGRVIAFRAALVLALKLEPESGSQATLLQLKRANRKLRL